MPFDRQILQHLSSAERDRFERTTNEILIESFIFTADRDYLIARFAFFQKQSHLFLWSAAQAIEKYLKANISLLAGKPITTTHRLGNLASELRKSHPERLAVALTIPDGWSEVGVAGWTTLRLDEFLGRLEECGSPDVRYDQVRLTICLQDLVYLDRLAFSLRDRIVSESVVESESVSDFLRKCFFDFNVAFAPPGYIHPEMEGLTLHHATVSTLEAALNGIYGHSMLYREWAEKVLCVPSKKLMRLLNRKS